MIIGGMLVAVEINLNLQPSKHRRYLVWSKSQKKWVNKKRNLNKDYSFRQGILKSALDHLRSGKPPLTLDLGEYVKRAVPRNIVSVPRPTFGAVQSDDEDIVTRF